MACSDYNTLRQAFQDHAFMDAILCGYQETMTGILFGMIVYGVVMFSIYHRTQSVLIPTILTMLVGGSILSTVAAPAIGLFVIVFILLFGIAPIVAIKRLSTP